MQIGYPCSPSPPSSSCSAPPPPLSKKEPAHACPCPSTPKIGTKSPAASASSAPGTAANGARAQNNQPHPESDSRVVPTVTHHRLSGRWRRSGRWRLLLCRFVPRRRRGWNALRHRLRRRQHLPHNSAPRNRWRQRVLSQLAPTERTAAAATPTAAMATAPTATTEKPAASSRTTPRTSGSARHDRRPLARNAPPAQANGRNALRRPAPCALDRACTRGFP